MSVNLSLFPTTSSERTPSPSLSSTKKTFPFSLTTYWGSNAIKAARTRGFLSYPSLPIRFRVLLLRGGIFRTENSAFAPPVFLHHSPKPTDEEGGREPKKKKKGDGLRSSREKKERKMRGKRKELSQLCLSRLAAADRPPKNASFWGVYSNKCAALSLGRRRAPS